MDLRRRHIELEADEVILLREACRTLDTVDELQRRLDAADVLDERYGGRVHPALPELRAQRLALSRLLKALDISNAAAAKAAAASLAERELRNPGGGVVVKRINPTEPPLELESYSLFAARRASAGRNSGSVSRCSRLRRVDRSPPGLGRPIRLSGR